MCVQMMTVSLSLSLCLSLSLSLSLSREFGVCECFTGERSCRLICFDICFFPFLSVRYFFVVVLFFVLFFSLR